MQILINGRILYRKITGVERYAHETILEIDKKIAYHEFKLAIPAYYDERKLPAYKNLEIIKIDGINKDILWEQISLPGYAKKNKGIVVSFDFSTPVFSPGIATIHDMSFRVNRSFFKNNIMQRLVRIKLEIYCRSVVKSKNIIFTVSEFQKGEIINNYNVDEKRIIVAGNGWQHFQKISEDDSVLKENHLQPGSYFFSLSSNTVNKNFKWVYEVAKVNPESQFVIAGGKTSISLGELESEKNIIYLGYQSDERIKSLYRNCKAFLFPSIYEGFGIPPMEALSVGAKVIAANTSCIPEIYGDAIYYIDPFNSDIFLDDLMESRIIPSAEKVLEKYSWAATADRWIEQLRNIAKQ